jgi:hypothetical protein
VSLPLSRASRREPEATELLPPPVNVARLLRSADDPVCYAVVQTNGDVRAVTYEPQRGCERSEGERRSSCFCLALPGKARPFSPALARSCCFCLALPGKCAHFLPRSRGPADSAWRCRASKAMLLRPHFLPRSRAERAAAQLLPPSHPRPPTLTLPPSPTLPSFFLGTTSRPL